MFNFFRKCCNEIKKEVERRRYRNGRKPHWAPPSEKERSRYTSYFRHGSHYQGHFKELTMMFNDQRIMLDKNIIEYNEWVERAGITDYFTDWCRKNLKGFYDIHTWGDDIYGEVIGNSNQIIGGIWCIHVDVMRKSDMVLLKMVWG